MPKTPVHNLSVNASTPSSVLSRHILPSCFAFGSLGHVPIGHLYLIKSVSSTCPGSGEYTILRYFRNIFETGFDHPLLVFLRRSRIQADLFASLNLPRTPLFDLAAFHGIINTWPRPRKQDCQLHEAFRDSKC